MYSLNIEKSTLVLNKEQVLRNIQKMVEKARKNGVRFRPHFKTHQSAQIGEWFRDFGVESITVSSMDMAEYFMNYERDDITVTFPVNVLEIHRINLLAPKIRLNLLVESTETVSYLGEKISSNANVWLKIDVGYKRTGIPVEKADLVIKLVKEIEIAKNLRFTGLLTHAGHSYYTKSPEEIVAIHQESVFLSNNLREKLQENGIEDVQISIGDTLTCSLADDFSDVDEIRPGNFLFYDLTQRALGSCQEENIAVVVACPVVAKHVDRKELVIYGGAIHFSLSYLERNDNTKIYGYMALPTNSGWKNLRED
ncbi:MAG: alanine racemase [Promethearchaeota archaeon]